MVQINLPRLDERVAEILADPDGYFARATARAWTMARAEVDEDLIARDRLRRNHLRRSPQRPTWLHATVRMLSKN
jgi:hypothetical protein